MSRALRFRVWNTIKRAYEPVGDMANGPFISLRGTYHPVAAGEFYPVVIEQWTGLLDKAGREIYEGDMLSLQWDGFYVSHHPVTWDWAMRFAVDHHLAQGRSPWGVPMVGNPVGVHGVLEVVGHIHHAA